MSFKAFANQVFLNLASPSAGELSHSHDGFGNLKACDIALVYGTVMPNRSIDWLMKQVFWRQEQWESVGYVPQPQPLVALIFCRRSNSSMGLTPSSKAFR